MKGAGMGGPQKRPFARQKNPPLPPLPPPQPFSSPPPPQHQITPFLSYFPPRLFSKYTQYHLHTKNLYFLPFPKYK